ncbi:MAG: hypothetical protein RL033_5450 [Pseudomonadota bacterium]|jgi:beta-lactamase regulating signal transducer with metallopeptidase domain
MTASVLQQLAAADGAIFSGGMVRWLAGGVLDGTLFAGAAWLATRTVLRRSSGRLLALLWLLVLVDFVLLRPVLLRPVLVGPALWGPALLQPVLSVTVPQLGVLAAAGEGAPLSVLSSAYAAVVVLLLARLCIRQQRLRRYLRTLPLAEPAMLAQVRAAAGKLGYSRIPEVRMSEAPITPYTLGPWQPTLVLPRWLDEPGARLEAVLLHELAHLQRRDHWFLWLERGVASLFFFWPPVHWVCRKLDEARELACDERAMARAALSPVDYGEHLLAVVTLARCRRTLSSTLGMGRAGARLERRIERLLQAEAGPQPGAERGPSAWERLVLGLLLVGALFGVRPTRDLTPPLAAQQSGLRPSEPAPVSEEGGGPLMSIAEGPVPSCTMQSCGTQCAP